MFKLPNHVYDLLKFLCTIFLPACGTLYFALSKIWGLPLAEEIVGTLSAIAVFIGAIIGISSVQYNKENDDGR
jgi:hypothetical protein